MRFIWSLSLLATLLFAPPPCANASTVTLPLSGEVEIVGDLPAPTAISLLMTVTPAGASFWYFNTDILQGSDVGGPFAQPTACVGADCGTLAGLTGCGGKLACDTLLASGFIATRNGIPVFFDISDTSRFLTLDTSVFVDSPIGLELTADLPDGLGLLVIRDPIPLGLLTAQTPLPTAVLLFATGLGIIGPLGWHAKRRRA